MKAIAWIKRKAGSIAHGFTELPKERKLQILATSAITATLFVAIPVYAWFSNQRKAAEMFKVDYPNSLYINAAHRQDQVQFELGGININEYLKNESGQFVNAEGTVLSNNQDPVKITKKQYVFSVSGSNADCFILQMAHTTNNMFTYRIYEATQQDSVPASGEYVEYKTNHSAYTQNPLLVVGDDVVNTVSDETKYYVKGAEVVGQYKNAVVATTSSTSTVEGATTTISTVDLAKKATDDSKYYPQVFGTNTNVQERAIPLYWQNEITGLKDEWDSNKRFCRYYILEVTWENRSGRTIEDKETDLLYLSVKRTG